MQRLAILVSGCLVCLFNCTGCRGCGSTPVVSPPAEYLNGRPVSSFVQVENDLKAQAERRGLSQKDLVAERVHALSPGNPIGRGAVKKLKAFKYIYREMAPSAVKTERELSVIASEISTAIEQAGNLHGRPFVLIPESTSGWLFNETIRVAVPVQDSVQAPNGLMAAMFDGTMVTVEKDKAVGSGGSIDEMERWAEMVLQGGAGGEVDFSGPFLMRFAARSLPVDGPVLWDWMIPSGPLPVEPAPGTAPAPDVPVAPAAPAAPASAVSPAGGN